MTLVLLASVGPVRGPEQPDDASPVSIRRYEDFGLDLPHSIPSLWH